MKSGKRFVAAGIFFSLLPVLFALGCSKGQSPSSIGIDPKSESGHIGVAGRHVLKFNSENKGQAPKNTDALKDWAAKNNIPEDELKSTRDHEPYEIHQVMAGPMTNTILTESTGEKGKKFMWESISHAPAGSEATQDEIDSKLKPHGAAGRGRPGS